MAELAPYPLDRLILRMFKELDQCSSIFDLPAKRFFIGDSTHDVSVRFHGKRASSPLGPSAGPQSQLAQNIVLAWLGGSRVFELKTVQVLDELDIKRPCIDAHNVCYNIEWSQELNLEQSLDEYVKAAMLIEMLKASGKIKLTPGFDDVIYDMSVGYDLAGIQSPRVEAFIQGMMDASSRIEHFRQQIPTAFGPLRDLDFQTRLSESLTLSTFHGCPPEEIHRIIEHLLERFGLHCVVKLNPTLLGKDRVRHLMHDEMGYHDVITPDSAFEKDASWPQMVAFVTSLAEKARQLGCGFGVKFSNTLIAQNHRDYLPESEKEMYLSGQPLHVLAMHLVRDFRRHFADSIPISFSAGIDKHNFADAVALGLTPITTCTDLLRPGGYGRLQGYHQSLVDQMDAVGTRNIDGYILQAYGSAGAALSAAGATMTPEIESTLADGTDMQALLGSDTCNQWLSQARLLNTELYVDAATADARYAQRSNSKVPRKMGSQLTLFDCVTCDKCIPVCPNDANFALHLPAEDIAILKLCLEDGAWRVRQQGEISLKRKHQIANFADFCNECGNCDVFCPEDGGPYIIKPRFFGSLQEWKRYPEHDGFYLQRSGQTQHVFARFEHNQYELVQNDDATVSFRGEGFDVTLDPADPERSARVVSHDDALTEIDLTWCLVMNRVREAVFHPGAAVNYVNA